MADGEKIYAVGGALTADASTAISGLLLYEGAGFSLLPPPFYTANASAQGGLSGAAAALNSSDGSLFVVSGVNNKAVLQSGIAHFDPVARVWRVVGGVASARTGHCSLAFGDNIVTVGGVDASGKQTGSVEIFNVAQGETIPGAAMPVATAGHGCLLISGEIWTFGGSTAAGVTDAVSIYDPVRDVWRAGPSPLLEPRTSTAVAFIAATNASSAGEGVVFVVGGADANGELSDSVFAFNTSSGVFGGWTYAPPLKRAVLGAGLAPTYEPHSDSRIMGEGPNNGGWLLTLVGGLSDTSANAPALSTSQQMKIYDFAGDYRYVPASTEAIASLRAKAAARGGSAAAQFQRLREQSKAAAVVAAVATAVAPPPPQTAVSMRDPAAPIWPGIEFLSHTYNPVLANPGSARDAGWLAQGAFQVACDTCFANGNTLNGFAVRVRRMGSRDRRHRCGVPI